MQSPMNDHHFSYPVVVPLGTMTISGHSNSPAPSLGSPQRVAAAEPVCDMPSLRRRRRPRLAHRLATR